MIHFAEIDQGPGRKWLMRMPARQGETTGVVSAVDEVWDQTNGQTTFKNNSIFPHGEHIYLDILSSNERCKYTTSVDIQKRAIKSYSLM